MTDARRDAESEANAIVLREILEGAAPTGGWLLNRGDPGLFASLDRLTAEEASAVPPGGTSSIAAHVEHLRYGLGLLNRSVHEENPFADADWKAAWRRTRVSTAEWNQLRTSLREAAREWLQSFRSVAAKGELERTGVLASTAHLAYHLGAIRQLSPIVRGPSAEDH